MSRNKKIIFSLFITVYYYVILTGCHYKKEKEITEGGSIIKREYYTTGNVQSEGTYVDDSIKNGWYKTYYETGELKEEKNYDLGKKTGLQKSYFKNGNFEKKILFKKGVQDGEALGYFENGKIKSQGFWKEGKGYGNALYYYLDGKLKHYNCYDLFGEIMYVIKWDSLGNKIKEEGLAISINRRINYPSDSVPQGKELVLYYTAAQPPNYTTTVKIKEINSKGEKLSEQIYPIIENTVTYKKIFNQKGKYKIIAVGEVKDSNGNTITRDTVETDIIVL